jgi:amidase
MKRREFVKLGMLASLGAMTGGGAMAATVKSGGVNIVEVGAADLQAAMTAGKITSRQLVKLYLARIKAIDKSGPRLNSVIELNPEAEAIAAALDKERKAKGPRGPLHGIPVLIKDNIATADKMQTTAGSLALVGSKPPRDAFIVKQLRDAGAVIIGKTNLSEWANMRSTRSTSGWSARGGLTRNPYALDRNTSGSSSGSGAAAAASLATLTVGTETDGSIISPSNSNGIVGFKPTVGLVSRAGIIPISHSQDTAGPMVRSVTDAALLMTVLAGSDARDAATADADSKKSDYTKYLDPKGLQGKRIGVVKSQFGGRNDLVSAVIEAQLDVLKAQGATLVEIPELPNASKYGQSEYDVLLYELKAGMAAYLGEYAPDSPHKTLADLIAFNEKNKDRELRYFGQEHFIRAQAKGGLDSKEYLDALANNRKFSRAEGIDKALTENKLDALVAPAGGPAWLTDLIKGDAAGGGFTAGAAVAGYPHITVPAGFVSGLPCGISFVGTAWSEPVLFAIAYAYEQASNQRKSPKFPKSVNLL